MKLLPPIFLSMVGLLFADDQTYFIQQPNMEEWKPPVEVVRELPDAVVKKSHVVEQEGRKICIEHCEPPAVEPKIKKVKPAPVVELTQEQQEQLEQHVGAELVHISATVYYEGDKPYSKIRLHLDGEKVEAWSSMNFMEMAGMGHFMARGIEYYTLVGHGEETTMSASEAGCPVHRDKLNKKKARFLVEGKRDVESEALEAMRGLHAIYNKEKETLQTAYKVRVANQEKARIWHEANPPKPKDVTIRIWKRDSNTNAE